MLGKVISIREIESVSVENSRARYDGYKIVTDKHTILFLINMERQCCEEYGYFSSDDDLKRYIGKELLSISTTDDNLTSKEWMTVDGDTKEDAIFLTLRFEDGDVLQFAVYNEHNGYYGHMVYLMIDKEIEMEMDL